MTIALVHGNPEVAAIWDDLIAVLTTDAPDRSVVALSPPGFGAPVPDGFASTTDEYADWLIAELDRLDGPIHVIGHDWGGGHVINALGRWPDMMTPDRIASVTTDVAGLFAPGYEWHDAARGWRTPEVGEQMIEAMAAASRDDRIAFYTELGMSPAAAAASADAIDTMGPHILALYRSADEAALVETGRIIAALSDRPPMHVIMPTDDQYTGGEALTTTMAAAWDATLHRLDGLGHWWMMQDPERAAAVVDAITG